MSLYALMDRKDRSRYWLDRERKVQFRSATWSQATKAMRPDSVVKVYMKINSEPIFERCTNRSQEYMFRKYKIDPEANLLECEAMEAKEAKIEKVVEISPEDAEKISEEMISSFSKKRDIRELLEGAKFFAGASALAGAPSVRRARRSIIHS